MRFYEPAPDLRGLISKYYVLDFDVPRLSDIIQTEATNIRFALGGSYRMALAGADIACSGATMFGPRTQPLSMTATGPGRALGVGVLPMGMQAIAGFSARELTDKIIPLEDVLGAAAVDAQDRMLHAPDDQTLIRIADAFFRAAWRRRPDRAALFQQAVAAWLKDCDDPQIDDLVSTCDLSARQVERLTARYFGMSPKLLARQGRVLRAAAKLRLAPDLSWTDAAGAGFFDQSHFIRDFRAFVGMTPTEFRQNKAPATSAGLRARTRERLISPLSLLS
jgi:AraC-like DNA-binding protein|tara:strand:- start:155504 stop:156337 length:834 start_codon:yes stop_codon:yes gene_type:complete